MEAQNVHETAVHQYAGSAFKTGGMYANKVMTISETLCLGGGFPGKKCFKFGIW